MNTDDSPTIHGLSQMLLSSNDSWCITGKSSGIKQAFFNSLISKKASIVSLELATNIILEERKNDDSEYVEGGVDAGRTVFRYLSEAVNDVDFETHPIVALCGITHILKRGLKYLSTGEMRRTLFCKALLESHNLVLLHEPFAGLDAESHSAFFKYIDELSMSHKRRFILNVERFSDVPSSIEKIVEFIGDSISFIGNQDDYKNLLQTRLKEHHQEDNASAKRFLTEFIDIREESNATLFNQEQHTEKKELIRFNNVNVGWGDNKVLQGVNWTLVEGEHTLIRGPNGSGKTTLLELITGDNTQVYCNDIWLFGKKRGSGETIWDIKKQLGIVSYKLHVEYKMLGGIDLEAVVLSGFHDSIGLYEQRSPVEQKLAKRWLHLGGFEGRENENFAKLSYGEQRVVLILRAAVKGAPILILDEPCHGLDDEWREKILSLMDVIASKNVSTILHVTHDETEIREFEKHRIELIPRENPTVRHTIQN